MSAMGSVVVYDVSHGQPKSEPWGTVHIPFVDFGGIHMCMLQHACDLYHY